LSEADEELVQSELALNMEAGKSLPFHVRHLGSFETGDTRVTIIDAAGKADLVGVNITVLYSVHTNPSVSRSERPTAAFKTSFKPALSF
jgi:hypothetical protein